METSEVQLLKIELNIYKENYNDLKDIQRRDKSSLNNEFQNFRRYVETNSNISNEIKHELLALFKNSKQYFNGYNFDDTSTLIDRIETRNKLLISK